jgi:hypothetical protein
MRVERIVKGQHQVDESGVYDESFACTLVLIEAEAAALLAEYQPGYAASPSVTLTRPPVRLICAALLEVPRDRPS